jgi:hypothetical protein
MDTTSKKRKADPEQRYEGGNKKAKVGFFFSCNNWNKSEGFAFAPIFLSRPAAPLNLSAK